MKKIQKQHKHRPMDTEDDLRVDGWLNACSIVVHIPADALK
jgi:hypothetical protein